MGDKYSKERIEVFGVKVEEFFTESMHCCGPGFLWWMRCTGTREQLISTGLVNEHEFPVGRKRVAHLGDDKFGFRGLRKVDGGKYEFRFDPTQETREYLRALSVRDKSIENLPSTAEDHRERARSILDRLISDFVRAFALIPRGGYSIDIDEDEFMLAAGALFTLVDTAPIRYSERKRAEQIQRYKNDADRMHPKFRRFMHELERGDAGPS